MEEYIVLVNDKDEPVGLEEKIEVHRLGLLHRAFSVFIVDSEYKKMFLQKRASGKYHSPGLWTNACCSHLREGEDFESAISRRMKEELGVETPVNHLFDFRYRAEFDNGLTENEIDHVYLGVCDGPFDPSPEEVDECKWVELEELDKWIKESPESFTAWFLPSYPEVRNKLMKK